MTGATEGRSTVAVGVDGVNTGAWLVGTTIGSESVGKSVCWLSCEVGGSAGGGFTGGLAAVCMGWEGLVAGSGRMAGLAGGLDAEAFASFGFAAADLASETFLGEDIMGG